MCTRAYLVFVLCCIMALQDSQGVMTVVHASACAGSLLEFMNVCHTFDMRISQAR